MKNYCYTLFFILFAACSNKDKCALVRKEKVDFTTASAEENIKRLEQLRECGFDSIDYKYIAPPLVGTWMMEHVHEKDQAMTYGTIADMLNKLHAAPGYAENRRQIIKTIRERAAAEIKGPEAIDYTSLCETPAYAAAYGPCLTKEMRELPAYFDYNEALACAKKQHKKLLVYFTGINCVNCRKMEQKVLGQEVVSRTIRGSFILATLYADGNPNGDAMAKLQEDKFNSNAQPTFIIVNEKGKELARAMYTPDAEDFLSFLKKGMATK